MKLLQTFSAAIMFVFASCCASSKTITSKESNNSAPLYETKWLLKQIYTEEGIREVNTKAFIRFDKEKNGAAGNGSCNSFGSTTAINGNEISFKNIFSTKMYCEGVQPIEDLFFKQLSKINSYKIEGKKLKLFSNGKQLLEFEAE